MVEEQQPNCGQYLGEPPGRLPSCTKTGQCRLGHGMHSFRGVVMGAAYWGRVGSRTAAPDVAMMSFWPELVSTCRGELGAARSKGSPFPLPVAHQRHRTRPCKLCSCVSQLFVPAGSHSGYQVRHLLSSSGKKLQGQPLWITGSGWTDSSHHQAWPGCLSPNIWKMQCSYPI